MTQKTAWETEKQLGLAGVDGEHSLQQRLVSVLRQAIEQGRERAVILELLGRIEATSNLHFMSEELLMRRHAYDQYASHVEEHRRLMEQLAEIREGLEAGQPDLAASAGRIEAWLESHIRGMDRRFIESLGPRAPGA
jgi:hemerythrin